MRPPPECVGDADYESASQDVRSRIIRGSENALRKWEKRVTPTIDVCSDVPILRPENWITKFSLMPHTMPERFSKYGKQSSTASHGCCLDWLKYLKIMKEFNTIARGEGDEEHRVIDIKKTVEDPQCFWKEYSHRLPSLFKVSNCVFAIAFSGADVERSFKKLRCVLPKDHTRRHEGADVEEGDVLLVQRCPSTSLCCQVGDLYFINS